MSYKVNLSRKINWLLLFGWEIGGNIFIIHPIIHLWDMCCYFVQLSLYGFWGFSPRKHFLKGEKKIISTKLHSFWEISEQFLCLWCKDRIQVFFYASLLPLSNTSNSRCKMVGNKSKLDSEKRNKDFLMKEIAIHQGSKICYKENYQTKVQIVNSLI